MSRTTRFVMVLFAVLLVPGAFAQTSNISGQWIIQTKSPGGHTQSYILLLNQFQAALTGSLRLQAEISTGAPSSNEIVDGKVEGSTVSFYIWRGTDQPVKHLYKGIISGDQIRFTITMPPIPEGASQGRTPGSRTEEVVAQRAK
jgi:hypothetical protein